MSIKRVGPIVVIAMLLLALPPAVAQDLPEFEEGLKPFGTYHGGDIDNVSLTNGNLNVRALLFPYPQRGGKLHWDWYLFANSKNWSFKTHCDRFGDCLVFVQSRGSGSVAVNTLESITPSSRLCTVYEPPGTTHPFTVPMKAARTADGATHVMGATGSSTYESLDLSGIRYDSSTGTFTDRQGVRYLSAGPSYPYVTREDPNGNEITVPGPSSPGMDTLGRTSSTGAPATCPTGGGLLPVSGSSALALPGPASAGGATELTMCGATVTLATNFPDADEQYNGTASYLQSVVLPNGTAWSFLYDSYGNITKILFPLGGSLSYTWTTFIGPIQDSRYVTSRTLDANDGTGGHTWNYAWTGTGPSNVTVTDPLGNDSVYTSTFFNASPYVTQAQYYQGSHTAGALLKTVATDYAASTAVPYVDCGWGLNTAVFNVHPIRATTTMGGKVSKVETDYDTGFNFQSPDPDSTATYAASYGDVTAKREYNWGAPGPLVRQTLTSYPALSASSYQTNNLLDLVSSVTVEDGSGNQKAATLYGYDATTPSASGITTQHDSNPPDGAYRGNQTSVSRWLSTTGTYLTTTNTYFDTGMLYTSADPASHTTTYGYSSNFAGAYVTSVADPMSHATGYGYDFNTGLRTSVTDVNGQTTSYNYDSMWRPSQIAYPTGGGSATFTYVDSTSPSMSLSRTVSSGVNYSQTALLDGVGRVKQTQLTSDPDGPTYVVTTYDAAGRKATVSNPYRSTSDPTYGITGFGYDALSRVTSVTSPSGGSVTTTYADNCTTVTDQQGKPRTSCTDGLGRLTQVFEPGSVTAETDYFYDTLDNLTQTRQKGDSWSYGQQDWRTRTFSYDSLSRLLSANNPESGTTTYTYNYGADKLLSSKQDARAITTTYALYDADHRLLSKTYSDTTPGVSYAYDGSGCLGRPSCYNVHHRTSMTDGAGSEAWAYDAMGRAAVEQRTTNSVTKAFTYGYTDDGTVNSITYPSGHVITYDIKGALRPDWAKDTGSGINYATAVTYWPQGAIMTATYGGVINRSDTYSERLQPSSLTATAGSTTLLNLSYNFTDGSGHNNGNVMGVANNKDTTRTQTFSYDQLNRIRTASTSVWSQTFTTDIWGNLYSIVATGGAPGLSLSIRTNNRVLGLGYDAAGNMTNDGLYNYAYDAENRQTSAAGVTYTYDGDGKRAKKSSGKLYWYGLSADPLLETDLGGSLLNEYVSLGATRIARRDSTGAVYYYLGDHLGSSRVSANSAGTLCYDADFYPYGGERVITNTCPQNYKFTGKERDSETQNDYFGARFYANNLGRLLSTDPLQPSSSSPNILEQFLTNPQNWNKYAYSRNSPTRSADPSGTFTRSDHEEIQVDSMLARGYSVRAARTAAEANKRMDSITGTLGGVKYANAIIRTTDNPLHGESNRNQSAEEAGAINKAYVSNEIRIGAVQALAGEINSALEQLGRAGHAAQDAVKHDFISVTEHPVYETTPTTAQESAAIGVTVELLDQMEQQITTIGHNIGLSQAEIQQVIDNLKRGQNGGDNVKP